MKLGQYAKVLACAAFLTGCGDSDKEVTVPPNHVMSIDVKSPEDKFRLICKEVGDKARVVLDQQNYGLSTVSAKQINDTDKPQELRCGAYDEHGINPVAYEMTTYTQQLSKTSE